MKQNDYYKRGFSLLPLRALPVIGFALLLLFSGMAVPAVAVPDHAAGQSTEKANNELAGYFFAAARTGNVAVLKKFLTHDFPVNIQNEQGYSALMIAAYHGQAGAVAQLLRFDADACLRDARGNTALMAAIVKAELAIAARLYRHPCDPGKEGKAGLSLHEFADMFGQGAFIKKLETEARVAEDF